MRDGDASLEGGRTWLNAIRGRLIGIDLGKVASTFTSLFSKPIAQNGFNQSPDVLQTRHLVGRTGAS